MEASLHGHLARYFEEANSEGARGGTFLQQGGGRKVQRQINRSPGVDRQDPKAMDVAVGKDDEWALWAQGSSRWRIRWPPAGRLHSPAGSRLPGPRPQPYFVAKPSL